MHEFDATLASPARLAIIAALIQGRPKSFMELRSETGLADGNLHVQTRHLAEAGCVGIRKTQQGRRTITTFQLTEAGLARFRLFVRQLQAVLDSETGDIRAVPGGSGAPERVW
jgi:hypothetical protein